MSDEIFIVWIPEDAREGFISEFIPDESVLGEAAQARVARFRETGWISRPMAA